jgi:hypothetical protein
MLLSKVKVARVKTEAVVGSYDGGIDVDISQGPIVTKLSSSEHQHLYQEGDPLADAVILRLWERGIRKGDMLAQARMLADEDGVFRRFLDEVSSQPDWFRPELVESGQGLFLRCAPLSLAAFVLGTLPWTYAPPGSARVLIHTGRLRQDVVRRLYETATMVQALMEPGGLVVGSAGHDAILRVRLLHAMVRQHVLSKAGWPSQELGAPINQLQLGFTAVGFGVLMVRSLRRMGATISQQEAQAYQHLWRYANHLQGVDTRLQACDLMEEAALARELEVALVRPDDNSKALVSSVHDALAWHAPFFLPKGALQAITVRLLGRSLAGQLGVPDSAIWGAVVAVFAGLVRLMAWRRHVPGWRALETRLGRRYFNWLVDKGLAGKVADYNLKTVA